MVKKRSLVIALTLLAVIAAAAIVCVVLFVISRSTLPGGAGVSTPGISAMAGGISWLELYVVAGSGLTILFVLAAFIALLVTKRNRAES